MKIQFDIQYKFSGVVWLARCQGKVIELFCSDEQLARQEAELRFAK